MAPAPLDQLAVNNRCVVLCDLRIDGGPAAASWEVLEGDQDDVGRAVAARLLEAEIQRIEDFGGVCKTILCDGDVYRASPPRIHGASAVFSFTPRRRIALEGLEMARVARAAGYRLLVLTVQKEGKYGKVWVLRSVLGNMPEKLLTYYEDTHSVVDELKEAPEGGRARVIHVRAPGYEDCVSRLADGAMSQEEYRSAVLEG